MAENAPREPLALSAEVAARLPEALRRLDEGRVVEFGPMHLSGGR